MKSQQSIVVSLLVVAILIGGAILLTNRGSSRVQDQELSQNVSVIDGTQFIDIRAKGGYSPRLTYAQSGIPTILRVETTNTFDCSSSLVIPSIKYRTNLTASGVTEIELPSQKAGSKLNGLCSMGMYGFEVRFN
ncbi:MAG: hypothetical protein NUV96_00975 [Candidatus Colwellbacteria bacterium]|nr:hypothetical protein [Candidatus Colwellbacteria bacterium]